VAQNTATKTPGLTTETPKDTRPETEDKGTGKTDLPAHPTGKPSEKKEPGTDQPKEGGKSTGPRDPLVAKLIRATDSEYKDYGFRNYGFGQSKQALNEVIKLQNLLPSMDDTTLRSFDRYGWIPTANKGVIGEFFCFNDDKLVGFGKLYRGDNKGYLEALVKEFGKASLENTYAQGRLQAEVGQEEKASATTRLCYYYFFPKTVVGICAVAMNTLTDKHQQVELCIFERNWFENTLNQDFARMREKLAEKKKAAAIAPAIPKDKRTEAADVLGTGLSIRYVPFKIGKPEDRVGDEGVPCGIVDPRLRTELAKATGSVMWITRNPIPTPQLSFTLTEQKEGFGTSFVPADKRKFARIIPLKTQACVVYLLEDEKNQPLRYRKWTGEGWGEPSRRLMAALGKGTTVPLTATRAAQLDLNHKVALLREGVFAPFMYRSYALLAKEYFPSKEPTIRVSGTVKYGQQVNPWRSNYSTAPRLYQWRTNDGIEVGVSETAIHIFKGPVRTVE
jgi:hypothetical protein